MKTAIKRMLMTAYNWRLLPAFATSFLIRSLDLETC